MRLIRRKLLAIAGATLLAGTVSSGISVAEHPDSTQRAINTVLAETTGGEQISRTEIAWRGGAVIMAFPLPGERTAPPSSRAAQALEARAAGMTMAEYDETKSSEVTTKAGGDCPTEAIGNDWYCFYQYNDFGGRRLAWNSTQYFMIYFSEYSFVNKTSSWSNKGGKEIYVYGRTKSGSDASCTNRLWTEPDHSYDNNIGDSVDNRADCFKTSS